MDDPSTRARAPARLVRACERNRLSRQLMNDAYECLVPIIQRRCDDLHTVAVDRWSVAPEYRREEGGRACCPGG